mmetsp:Transcript_19518/g.32811  ORF Transcript_19518/g.32811 Transcript_19518/m.32811 type:complete len:347 (-) Transcript_19518:212-1252(-)|eukprot:CAMPEP_0198213102 /NCGR_PEP_ID=MMETSP1445-20131203/28674_1 /TAXON_ID=36898 /ORGANISM="Pyramimonas sp., Strain CCMP2087" /LENGTH=346 /DNA_ID=CAMNT_0043887699 /DNA_START=234 /DNA_END=1274 /DNA_ORIENTATION=-
MGSQGSKLEKALGEAFPADERFFGLENFGNTCYCNSVLQALYFCPSFRDRLLEYNSSLGKDARENLLTCLADLFYQIHTQKKKTGVISPKKFIFRLKQDNELFRSFMHQDAHEFLNFLLNESCEVLEKEHPDKHKATPQNPVKTWVHDVFQGVLTNETKCLCCETVTSREETFLDLSLDIEQNTSISGCLKNFSATETLNHEDKFFCDKCCCLQEAQKCMKVKALPRVLALHLKRFKYIESLGRYKKLCHRVVFPMELKMCNTADDAKGADSEYNLFAVVVHLGSGPNHGHYVSLVKSHDHWLYFDDENVEPIEESVVQGYFGSTQDGNNNTEHGYLLFYERAENN